MLSFLWTGIMLLFPDFWEILPVKDYSNSYFKVFTIVLPHGCIMRMKTLSNPCALVGFKSFIVRSILPSLISVSLNRFSVMKTMKRLAFVINFETTKSFTNNGRILGSFLPKKFLSIDHYVFGAVRGLSKFFSHVFMREFFPCNNQTGTFSRFIHKQCFQWIRWIFVN